MGGSRETVETAAKNSKIVVFGDTYHSIVPLHPMADNFDVLKDNGKSIYFIEQHYTLQPSIEKLARGEITEEEFRAAAEGYNDDSFAGHSEIADSIIAATKQGLRVVAFDTRATEELGLDSSMEVSPLRVEGYPEDLLGPIQRAYYMRDSSNFDRRSAYAVKEIAGDEGGVVWIGNRHINGSHLDGDARGDFDTYLGEGVSRIAMFYDRKEYELYVNHEIPATKDLKDCVKPDQPDFVYFAAEDVGVATSSAFNRKFDTGNMLVADIASVCYKPEEERILADPQGLMKGPKP